MRSAPLAQLRERRPQVTVEAAQLVRGQRPGRAGRVEAGPPQHLVGDEVADAGQPGLVHETGLQGRLAGGEEGGEVARREAHRVGAEAVLVGVELDRAQPPRVPHAEVAPIEAQDEAVPLLELAIGGKGEVGDGGHPVDHQPPSHPEVEADDGAVGVDQQELSAAAGPGDGTAGEGGGGALGRQSPLQVPAVGRHDLHDAAPGRLRGQPPVGLDLDQLGHPLPGHAGVAAPRACPAYQSAIRAARSTCCDGDAVVCEPPG